MVDLRTYVIFGIVNFFALNGYVLLVDKVVPVFDFKVRFVEVNVDFKDFILKEKIIIKEEKN